MDSTFNQLWQMIQVYCPSIPIPMAQEMINNSYSRALSYYPWGALRKDEELVVPAAYSTGTVTVVQGSGTVTGITTVWTAAMVGRQFYTDGQAAPLYTITAVDTGLQTLTLDRAYEKASDTTVYSISLVLAVMPADFSQLETVRDIANGWRLRLNKITQKKLDLVDPKRTVVGTTWTWVDAPPLINSDGTSTVRYEMWPRPMAAATYPFRYNARPARMSAATDRPIFPIRGDALRLGALSELSRWPGFAGAPNSYFDIRLHDTLEKEFADRMNELWRDDQAILANSITYGEDGSWPLSPVDSDFLRSHDLMPYLVA